MSLLGERIRALRLAKGLTQSDLAKALSVRQGYVSKLESGEKAPNVERLRQLATILGTSETYLLGPATERGAGAGLISLPAEMEILADRDAPPGLQALAQDRALVETLGMTREEWRALRSLDLPGSPSKSGYVQLLFAIRCACRL